MTAPLVDSSAGESRGFSSQSCSCNIPPVEHVRDPIARLISNARLSILRVGGGKSVADRRFWVRRHGSTTCTTIALQGSRWLGRISERIIMLGPSIFASELSYTPFECRQQIVNLFYFGQEGTERLSNHKLEHRLSNAQTNK